MRSALLVVVAVVLLGVSVFSLIPRVPKLVLEEANYDMGVIAVGEPAVHEVSIRNEGRGALELTRVAGQPGVNVDVIPEKISGGEKGKIRVTLDTVNLGGRIVIPVGFKTNDPQRKDFGYDLKVEVRAYVYVRPGFARYIYVQKAREGTITQTVGAADGADFRVVGAESDYAGVTVSFREALPAERIADWTGSQWRVDTTIHGDAPVGAISGNLVIRTDHPKQKRAFAALSGFVRPIYAVTPPEIRLGTVRTDPPARMQLHLKNFAEELIAITSATSDIPGVTTELKTVQAGRVYLVDVVVGPQVAAGRFNGKALLKTDSAKIPTIEVPLQGFVER